MHVFDTFGKKKKKGGKKVIFSLLFFVCLFLPNCTGRIFDFHSSFICTLIGNQDQKAHGCVCDADGWPLH